MTRRRSLLAAASTFGLTTLLAGCAAGAGAPAPTVTVTATVTVTPPSPTPSVSAKDATAIAKAMRDEVQQVRKVLTITEDNDPNDLLGRPTGYTSAAVLYDSRATCSDGPGANCGATVEQWSSHEDAAARAARIQSILKDSPILGTEYDTVRGDFVLRVAGRLKPSVAADYREAFDSLF